MQHLEPEVCPHGLFDISHPAVVTEYLLHHTSPKSLLYVYLAVHQLPVEKDIKLTVNIKHNITVNHKLHTKISHVKNYIVSRPLFTQHTGAAIQQQL